MVYHCGETNDTVCREQNVKLHIDNTIPIITTYVIIAYHHTRCEFEPCLWLSVLDTT
jgi:hypothetical protein